ncbi:MAG: F0F1 ATP synthase subunit epsilon [Fimbriiglobus sp.]|nr:F0F1 ATP synthase subunit epsilon [Fimbriiglobus sp.]
MADTTTKSLRVVVVTPERAVLDEPADGVVLPMFDGERGVLAGHAPFVGQLGPGELRIKAGGATKRFFIDGGFAQVTGSVVNVLTAKAIGSDKLTTESVTSARTAAEALPVTNAVQRENREKAIARAQGMAKVAAKNAAN